jgi:hypothetical protein
MRRVTTLSGRCRIARGSSRVLTATHIPRLRPQSQDPNTRCTLKNGSATLPPSTLSVDIATPGELWPYYTDSGISPDGGSSAADCDGYSYLANALAANGITPGATITSEGVSHTWPNVASGQLDNIEAQGQTIPLRPTTATKNGEHLPVLRGRNAHGGQDGREHHPAERNQRGLPRLRDRLPAVARPPGPARPGRKTPRLRSASAKESDRSRGVRAPPVRAEKVGNSALQTADVAVHRGRGLEARVIGRGQGLQLEDGLQLAAPPFKSGCGVTRRGPRSAGSSEAAVRRVLI